MLLRYFLNDIGMVPSTPNTLVSLLFLYSACAIFLFEVLHGLESSRLLSSSHFCLPRLQHLLTYSTYSCSSCITTDYDVRYVVTDGSVGSHVLVP